MAEGFDSSPPPADQATTADSVIVEPVPDAVFEDLLDALLEEEGVASDSSSASFLRNFLENLRVDADLGAGTGPSTARAPSSEGVEVAAALERSRLRRATAQAKVADEQQFLCHRMAAQVEPWISARAVMRVAAELSTSREALLRTAALSFLQGRYDEASSAVKSLVKIGVDLSSAEVDLFDQITRSVLQKLKDEATMNAKINEATVNLIMEVIELIDNCLLPFCSTEESLLYYSMKGDLLAFLAETYEAEFAERYRNDAILAYEEGFDGAVKKIDPLHPSLLRAAINLATFLDKSELSLRGYTIAKKAVHDIEFALKFAKKCDCSAELKSTLLLLNNLKEQLHVKLTGRKESLPYPEMVRLQTLEEGGCEVYKVTKTSSEKDVQSKQRYQSMGSMHK